MPITKSAKKALRKNEKRRIRNLRKKRELKRLIKELLSLIESKKTKQAQKLLPRVYKKLDKAAKTNLIKQNKASRLKSGLTKKINRVQKQK